MIRTEKLHICSLGETLKGVLFLPNAPTPSKATQWPVVILCHGAIDYKERFFGFAEFLANNGYAALALDMHGHGESGGEKFHVKMAEWVPDIQAAIEVLSSHNEIDASRMGALGFSSGGTAILEAAVKQLPLKVLVTLDATVRNVIPLHEVAFFKVMCGIGSIKRKMMGGDIKLPLYDMAIRVPVACNPDVSDRFFNDPVFKAGYQAYPLPGAIESVVIDTIERVDQITVPVCVIHGEEDKVDSPDSARLLFEKLRSEKQLNIVADSGHIGHMDNQKEKIHEIAKNWFDSYL
ncbi:alpha/beta hydrolase [Alkalimarinus sediminis]|uniref:Lysophospholipase n=1 Tax=Alkalimarinus sediminis TaxID=1632866 RepID=A0A9E8HMZ3_9ALTE|nr:alpha/beta fold hydrolase [Alkalimarinus sediminis]UZW75573.1 lysophospholipase [Alkalimarinus sediminis]